MSGLATKDLIVRLWPAEPIPSSYFGLVRRLVDALPRVEAVKRSACIEGAPMAFARVKMHWAKMKATDMATAGLPKGKDHRKPERYFEDVLAGARNAQRMLCLSECSRAVKTLFCEPRLVIYLCLYLELISSCAVILILKVCQSSASAPKYMLWGCSV